VSEGAPEAPAGKGVWRGRFRLAGAALLGAAAVAVAWLLLGANSGSGTTASLQVSSGISPVAFVYLDNVDIASYLAQLQGGAATTEQLSRQATQSRNASVTANGVGLGASASDQSTAELSLTVNNQSRFSDLLGLLQADGFLHAIDMAAPDPVTTREFAAVPVGSFVKLSDCVLTLPNYVQDEQQWRATKGQIGLDNLLLPTEAGFGTVDQIVAHITASVAAADRAVAEHRKPSPILEPNVPPVDRSPRQTANMTAAMNQLVRQAGTNPLIPFSSCSPSGWDPRAPDLLMPIRLGALTTNQSARTGDLTVVAKVMLAVRKPKDDYVDSAAMNQWSDAPPFTTHTANTQAELDDDAAVIAPGYYLQPIAIYK